MLEGFRFLPIDVKERLRTCQVPGTGTGTGPGKASWSDMGFFLFQGFFFSSSLVWEKHDLSIDLGNSRFHIGYFAGSRITL